MKPIFISKFIYEYTNNDKLTFLRDADHALFARTATYVGNPRYDLDQKYWKYWDMAVPEKYRGPKTFNCTNTFSDITDKRALELEQLVQSSEKPLGIMWSGGIDSTTIITACIRNFKSLNRLTVFMNNYSYYENSKFFYNVIKKYNLNVINIDGYTLNDRDKYIITDGASADPLWGVKLALVYLGSYPIDDSFISSKNNILEFIGRYIDPRFCNQYFDLIQNSIDEIQAPIITVHDWFSWINFNFYWVGEFIEHYSRQHCGKTIKNFSIFNKNTYNWYNTTEYQKWSFSEIGKQEKHFTNLSGYKITAKKYIHSVAKDDNALLYQTKCPSGYQYQRSIRDNNIVVFDDGTGIDNNEPERLQKFIQDYCLV